LAHPLSPNPFEDEDGNENFYDFQADLPEDGSIRPLVPLLDVVTLWSSGYVMLKRAKDIRPGLDTVAALEHDLRKYEIDPEEWAVCDYVIDFLQPFAVITKFVEGLKYPTLSCVIPLYNSLMDKLEDWMVDEKKPAQMKKAAKLALEKIMKYYEKVTDVSIVATIMDPRLKLRYFILNGWSQGSGDWAGKDLLEQNVKPA